MKELIQFNPRHLSCVFLTFIHEALERIIQSLEDLLRACVLEQEVSWSECLPLIEFTYNNSFHSGIGMTPFEALYWRRY
jgi:hypothetical protein